MYKYKDMINDIYCSTKFHYNDKSLVKIEVRWNRNENVWGGWGKRRKDEMETKFTIPSFNIPYTIFHCICFSFLFFFFSLSF